MPRVLASCLVLATAAACSATTTYVPDRKLLMQRASFDFQCPADRIAVTKLGGNVVGATGCGHRATYVRVAGGWGESSWVMNTFDDRVAPGSAATEQQTGAPPVNPALATPPTPPPAPMPFVPH